MAALECDFVDFAAFGLQILSILVAVLFAGQCCPALELWRPRLGPSSWEPGAPAKKTSNVGHFQRGELFFGQLPQFEEHATMVPWGRIQQWYIMTGRKVNIRSHVTCKLSNEKWCTSRFWYIARLQKGWQISLLEEQEHHLAAAIGPNETEHCLESPLPKNWRMG